MLVLARKTREAVVVGGVEGFPRLLKVTVVEISGGKVKLGFEVDADVPVNRLEVWERIQAERRGRCSRRPLVKHRRARKAIISRVPEQAGGDRDEVGWVEWFKSVVKEYIAMKERSLLLPLARSGKRRDRLLAGQAVEICRGALTGLSGVLVRRTGGSRWIVRVRGLPRGVLLAIDAVALIEGRTEPATASGPAQRLTIAGRKRGG